MSMGAISFAAQAAGDGEYEVTGRISSDSPIFNGKDEIQIANGYYAFGKTTNWGFLKFESEDGSLKLEYFLERDNVYRFIIDAGDDRIVYRSNDAAIVEDDGAPVGTVFVADGLHIDLSGFTFTKAGERFKTGFYKATGSNAYGADEVVVVVYNSVVDLNFYKDGNVVGHLGGNYSRINAAGTTTFTQDYEGFFTGNLTSSGRLYGGRISDDITKQAEFDLQLEEANVIKAGTYSAKGVFAGGIDEIRFDLTDMLFKVELLKAGNRDRLFEVALQDMKPDGTLVFISYDGNDLETSFQIAPDGTMTGSLYGGYNIDLNLLLTKKDS